VSIEPDPFYVATAESRHALAAVLSSSDRRCTSMSTALLLVVAGLELVGVVVTRHALSGH
jgi:hypothetical protein